MQKKPRMDSTTEREEKRTGQGAGPREMEKDKKSNKEQGREGGMKQQGQGAGTANDGEKGWRGEQHKTNHITTRQKEELRNRDREPEKKKRAGEQKE